MPAIELDDGRVLSESNAILWFLGEGSAYRGSDAFADAKILQWLSFEIDYIQNSIGSLRYWTLTGKLLGHAADMVAGKRATAERALAILDKQLSDKPFITGDSYTIADISLFAYTHLAHEGGLDAGHLPNLAGWSARVRQQDGHLAEMHPLFDRRECTARTALR